MYDKVNFSKKSNSGVPITDEISKTFNINANVSDKSIWSSNVFSNVRGTISFNVINNLIGDNVEVLVRFNDDPHYYVIVDTLVITGKDFKNIRISTGGIEGYIKIMFNATLTYE